MVSSPGPGRYRDWSRLRGWHTLVRPLGAAQPSKAGAAAAHAAMLHAARCMAHRVVRTASAMAQPCISDDKRWLWLRCCGHYFAMQHEGALLSYIRPLSKADTMMTK
ncbi:hypothetical protein E2562_022067 [Oryza meyeriana var. granulata]|uniref:Uncharacterized protein n=1 Tax=Oryza meyeriana var. granulata TaxID=110450 RepID=A0A6G1ENM0_9ORYZ|nr:hypothetical protein E2562_022067 [Oryza meyeriana var. granulata]